MKKLRLFLIILIIFACSCGTMSDQPQALPSNATNIVDLGNGWVQFTLEENNFIYHKEYSGNTGYEGISQVVDTKKLNKDISVWVFLKDSEDTDRKFINVFGNKEEALDALKDTQWYIGRWTKESETPSRVVYTDGEYNRWYIQEYNLVHMRE